MTHWLKRIAITVLLLILALGVLVLFVRYQGIQYIAAYTGGGFARALPKAETHSPPDSDKNTACTSGTFNVLTYNVMYGSAFIESMANRFRDGDTGGFLPWSVRLPEIRERIASYAPDLIGLQETDTDADIADIVPPSQYTLVSYHLGSFQYGDAALLFKTERFEQLDAGQLWLSPHPELPLALGFRPLAMIRYVNWVLLREKSTGFTFIFVNTHFDNASVNKEPSATLFRERIAALTKGLPMIVTGDFNTTANDERYLRFTGTNENPPLLRNAYTLAHEPPVNPAQHPDQRIDHILAGGACKVIAEHWQLDTRPLKKGQLMSDHDPITVQLRFAL
jgi:endonuclease/exonuclease/phosphatase family metal-dependent hydrolase